MSLNSEGDGYHPSETQQGSCPHPEIIHEVTLSTLLNPFFTSPRAKCPRSILPSREPRPMRKIATRTAGTVKMRRTGRMATACPLLLPPVRRAYLYPRTANAL